MVPNGSGYKNQSSMHASLPKNLLLDVLVSSTKTAAFHKFWYVVRDLSPFTFRDGLSFICGTHDFGWLLLSPPSYLFFFFFGAGDTF